MFRLPCDPSDRGVSTFPFPGPAGGPFRSVISFISVAGVVYPRRHWYTRLKSNSLSLNLACFTSRFLSSSSSSLSSPASRLAPSVRSGAVGVGFPVARRAKHPCRISPTPCQKSRETRRHGFPLEPSSWVGPVLTRIEGFGASCTCNVPRSRRTRDGIYACLPCIPPVVRSI